MEEKLHWLPTSIGMTVLACIFGGIVFAIYPGWDLIGDFFNRNINIDLDQNAPAWVQAVGSILTIVAGFIYVNRQIQSQAHREECARIGKIRLIANALFQCRKSVTAFSVFLPSWEEDTKDAEDVFWWIDYLSSIPSLEYPSFGSLNLISMVLSEGRVFKRSYIEYKNSSNVNDVLRSAEELKKRLETAEVAIENYLNDRGEYSPTQAFNIDGVIYFPAGRSNAGPDQGKRVVEVHMQKSGNRRASQ